MRATAKYLRVSPMKVSRLLLNIKGKNYTDAISLLEFTSSPTATVVKKVLASAGANATENFGIDKENLIVKSARVNEGPKLKRIIPCARGRATRMMRRMSHITIELGERE